MDMYSRQLVDAVDSVIAAWVERCVRGVAAAQGIDLSPSDIERLGEIAELTRREVRERLVALLGLDVDEQRGNPLDVMRRAVVHPTVMLRDLGARPVRRDEFAERVFPDDVYGLSPAAFSDIDESLTEPGIVWGAWKAKTVLSRRRAEGRI